MFTLGRIENEHRSGIDYQDLYRLAKFYNVSTDYLFGLTNNRHFNNEDTKGSSLSDEVIEVLKSEKLNNRLLCEIIAHSDFPALLSSIVVYIDRTLMPQLNAINAMYEFVERVIRKEFEVREYEDIVSALKQSKVDEGGYLLYGLTEYFHTLLKDIYEKHKANKKALKTGLFKWRKCCRYN